MSNPWENLLLSDYENHMKLSDVFQLQTLNNIMKSQINMYTISSIAILGIAGGNGLEHIDISSIKTVYGIDINQNYLNATKERYSHLNNCLKLIKYDLSDLSNTLPDVNMVIANLFIEYVGIDIFVKQLSKTLPKYVSCVIQINTDESFVSDSPYLHSFEKIADVHSNIDKNFLILELNTIGYNLKLTKEHQLPNGKKFIRLDFTMN